MSSPGKPVASAARAGRLEAGLVRVRESPDALALSLMLFQALTAAAIAVTPVVANELRDTFSLSSSNIGLLSSFFLMMFCIGAIPMGMAAARWGGRTLAGGAFTLLAGSLVFALAPSFGALLAGRLLQGLGASACVPVGNTLISREVAPAKQGRAFGLFGSGLGVGYLLTLAIMPSVEEAAGFRAVFLVLAAIVVVVALLGFSLKQLRALPQRVGDEGSFRGVARALGQVSKNPKIWLVAVINTGGAAVAVTLLAWTPAFLQDQHGAGLGVAAYLTAAAAAAQLVGSSAGAAVMARTGKIAVLLVSLAAMVVLTALVPAAPALGVVVLIVVLVGFLSMAVFPPVVGAIRVVVERPEQVGQATGLVFLFNIIGLMIPPWLFGKLLDNYGRQPGSHGYLGGYLMLGAFPLAGFLAALALRGITKRPDPDPATTTLRDPRSPGKDEAWSG